MRPEDIERFAAQRHRAIGSMMKSDSPQNVIEGALEAIGYLEENGEGGLKFRIIKSATVLTASFALRWGPKDILESLKTGREAARLANLSEDDPNAEIN